MKERSFDGMIAYFNRRVSEMDIAQDYKMELLGMVTALGYKHEKTAQQWIPGKPKESGMYLVSGTEHFVPDHVDEPSTKDGAVGIAAYSEKWGWLDFKIRPVKAYMPLPKPYVSRKRKKG